jgi:predicted GIY-YIG superfamily endonuclease
MSIILELTKEKVLQKNITAFIWFERYQYVMHAIEREKEIKGWIRTKKNQLIEQENPNWRFLNTDIMEWPPAPYNIPK